MLPALHIQITTMQATQRPSSSRTHHTMQSIAMRLISAHANAACKSICVAMQINAVHITCKLQTNPTQYNVTNDAPARRRGDGRRRRPRRRRRRRRPPLKVSRGVRRPLEVSFASETAHGDGIQLRCRCSAKCAISKRHMNACGPISVTTDLNPKRH